MFSIDHKILFSCFRTATEGIISCIELKTNLKSNRYTSNSYREGYLYGGVKPGKTNDIRGENAENTSIR